GNFSGPLAAGGAVVTAVESDGDAFADLEDLVARAGGRIHAIKADAAKWVRRAAEAGERFDAVLLDPPRPGAKGLAPWIARLAPETVVFVSCDPSTLARDLGAFRRHGYETTAVRPYDFFPQTYHVETLSVLARSSQEPASGD
ncbi:MAG: RsmD family RNA methyltransferase, partial [Myxococcales bacterium]|nr:RsmD family RNA methyltransferase [Myxococcales bacterium]